jgi:hypothetical protein
MDLTGANVAKLAYCLVNTPVHLVEDAKRKLAWKMGVIDTYNNEEYLTACQKLELNAYYDDIPEDKRYIGFTVDRNQADIDKAHKRVLEAREFLNQLNDGNIS